MNESEFNDPKTQTEPDDWLEKELTSHREFMRKRELSYVR